MPLTGPSRARVLRATGVVLITAVVWGAAACSDEDTVDTIPPPWPSATNQSLDEGPRIPTPTTTATAGTTHRSTATSSTRR
ncbi:MAG TPA: hypothetical protein VFM07_05760 [Intrasporangium sp.]|nr:hypothetical protein [Intrasporangium sp.]